MPGGNTSPLKKAEKTNIIAGTSLRCLFFCLVIRIRSIAFEKGYELVFHLPYATRVSSNGRPLGLALDAVLPAGGIHPRSFQLQLRKIKEFLSLSVNLKRDSI